MYHTIKNLNHHLTLLATAALALASLYSCNKLAEDKTPFLEEETISAVETSDQPGSIRLDVGLDYECVASSPTKAVTSYTTVENYEKAIVQVDVFVFHKATGILNAHLVVNSPTITDNHFSIEEVPCTQGIKRVFVVVNGSAITGLSSVTRESEFTALTTDLSHNSRETDKGFVMIGRSGDLNVTGMDTGCSISLRRTAYRVVLQKITNSTALGPITLKGAFLINSGRSVSVTMSNETTMPKASSAAYNVAGKKIGSSDFVTGSASSDVPDLLYQDLGNTVLAQGSSLSPTLKFYGLPHNAHDATPERLVLLANVGGTDFYYPMTLAATSGNQTYTVELTIRNIGSLDPNLPVATGDIDVSFTLMSWVTGNNQEVTI